MKLLRTSVSARGRYAAKLTRPAVPEDKATGVVIMCWSMGAEVQGPYYPDRDDEYAADVVAMQAVLPQNYAIGLVCPQVDHPGSPPPYTSKLIWTIPEFGEFPVEISTIEYAYQGFNTTTLEDYQTWQAAIKGDAVWETSDIWILWDNSLVTSDANFPFPGHIEQGSGERDYYNWLVDQEYTFHRLTDFGEAFYLLPGLNLPYYYFNNGFRPPPVTVDRTWVQAITEALIDFNAL